MRDPQVLDQVIRCVIDVGGRDVDLVQRKTGDGVVVSHVRLMSVEQGDQVVAQNLIGIHDGDPLPDGFIG